MAKPKKPAKKKAEPEKPKKPRERVFPPAKRGGYIGPDPASVPPPTIDDF